MQEHKVAYLWHIVIHSAIFCSVFDSDVMSAFLLQLTKKHSARLGLINSLSLFSCWMKMSKTIVLKTLTSLKSSLKSFTACPTDTSVFSGVVPMHVVSVELNVFLLCWRLKSFISWFLGVSVCSVCLTARQSFDEDRRSASKNLLADLSYGIVVESMDRFFPIFW